MRSSEVKEIKVGIGKVKGGYVRSSGVYEVKGGI